MPWQWNKNQSDAGRRDQSDFATDEEIKRVLALLLAGKIKVPTLEVGTGGYETRVTFLTDAGEVSLLIRSTTPQPSGPNPDDLDPDLPIVPTVPFETDFVDPLPAAPIEGDRVVPGMSGVFIPGADIPTGPPRILIEYGPNGETVELADAVTTDQLTRRMDQQDTFEYAETLTSYDGLTATLANRCTNELRLRLYFEGETWMVAAGDFTIANGRYITFDIDRLTQFISIAEYPYAVVYPPPLIPWEPASELDEAAPDGQEDGYYMQEDYPL